VSDKRSPDSGSREREIFFNTESPSLNTADGSKRTRRKVTETVPRKGRSGKTFHFIWLNPGEETNRVHEQELYFYRFPREKSCEKTERDTRVRLVRGKKGDSVECEVNLEENFQKKRTTNGETDRPSYRDAKHSIYPLGDKPTPATSPSKTTG